jgi:hypothetical protein
MKYIQINTTVNLSSGLSIPSGSICVVAEGYADVKSQKDGLIPSQVSTLVYANSEAFLSGKENVVGIADFNPVFSTLQLSVIDYETKTAEDLLVNAVYDELNKVYPNQVEIVTIA